MSLYNIITLIIVFTAIFGYINFKYIKLPGTIGIMLLSLVASLVVIAVGLIYPVVFTETKNLIISIDFHTALMKVMLSFLLFAGGIQIDLNKLKRESVAIFTFSTIGVLISTFTVAALFYALTNVFGLSIDFIYCLLFGALISPTDPIAVLGILRKAKIPPTLEIKISGESLFNDGVAVVVFVTIFEIITVGIQHVSAFDVILFFFKEAGGGIVFGLLLGYAGFWVLKSIDNYVVEVLITISIVMGGYMVAEYLEISGPLAMVVAGIITGNKSMEENMSDITRDYVDKFWQMMDEVFNAVLFLLMGFQMLIIPFNITLLWLGIVTIVIVIFARFISIIIPITVLRFKRTFEKNAVMILTWGGLKGGLSVALALSLPSHMQSGTFIPVTYIVVLFSIIVQGLTIGKFAKRLA